jgi:DNA repair exonuclease SbcCD ATPase subunit
MKTKCKLSLITLGTAAFFSLNFLSGCKSDADSENSQLTEDVNEVQQDLEDAKNESIAQYEAFKMDAEAKIDENIKALNELKQDAKVKTKEAKAELDVKLAELERRNQVLREKIRDYKDEGNENWEAFKQDFERDMDSISQSFKEVIK